jgi:hypothetical protein
MTYADLEAAYQEATSGHGEPNMIILPRDDLKRLCYLTGEVKQWFAFLHANLTDSGGMATRRLDPTRLPE